MNNWTKHLEKLRRFKLIYKHTNVPLNWDTDPVLAQWVENIRVSKRRLPLELLQGLQNLGFNFEFRNEKDWQSLYSQLVSFRKKYGHTRVPVTKPYEELSQWTQKLRDLKRKLPLKQITLLDQLGFNWQSVNKKRKEKKLSEEEYRLLNSLGLDWDARDAMWERGFEMLVSFKNQFNHLKVPEKTHTFLFRWISKQRQKHKIGKLPLDKIKKLKGIGFNLNLRWRKQN